MFLMIVRYGIWVLNWPFVMTMIQYKNRFRHGVKPCAQTRRTTIGTHNRKEFIWSHFLKHLQLCNSSQVHVCGSVERATGSGRRRVRSAYVDRQYFWTVDAQEAENQECNPPPFHRCSPSKITSRRPVDLFPFTLAPKWTHLIFSSELPETFLITVVFITRYQEKDLV